MAYNLKIIVLLLILLFLAPTYSVSGEDIINKKNDYYSSGPLTRITNNEFEDKFPEIYGDIIVWSDITNSRIYAYNIINRTIFLIFNNISNIYSLSSIYKDLVVCSDENDNIYVKNLSSGHSIKIPDKDSFATGIFDNYVMYENSSSINLYYINNNSIITLSGILK